MEDTAKQEILEAIGLLAEQMQENSDVSNKNFLGLENRMQNIEVRVDKIESQMVTKNYLDDKLASLRGDLVALTRKSNIKLSILVESLVKEGSLERNTADLILAMEPFATA